MSDKTITDLNQLKLTALRGKADATSRIAELADLVADSFAELENGVVVKSSTSGSSKKFRITVDDDGRLTTEVVAE